MFRLKKVYLLKLKLFLKVKQLQEKLPSRMETLIKSREDKPKIGTWLMVSAFRQHKKGSDSVAFLSDSSQTLEPHPDIPTCLSCLLGY